MRFDYEKLMCLPGVSYETRHDGEVLLKQSGIKNVSHLLNKIADGHSILIEDMCNILSAYNLSASGFIVASDEEPAYATTVEDLLIADNKRLHRLLEEAKLKG